MPRSLHDPGLRDLVLGTPTGHPCQHAASNL